MRYQGFALKKLTNKVERLRKKRAHIAVQIFIYLKIEISLVLVRRSEEPECLPLIYTRGILWVDIGGEKITLWVKFQHYTNCCRLVLGHLDLSWIAN